MKIIKIFTILFISYSISNGQSIGINTDNSSPDPSAILDVKSTTKGILIPRMTSLQRTSISSPSSGLLVYDMDTASFWFHNGSTWTNLVSSGAGGTNIADADGDTKVEVELTPDDDMIRFTTNGIEMAKMDGNTLHLGTSDQSIFIGNNSGMNDAGAERNIALGYEALEQNTSGGQNIAIGGMAMKNNTTISGLIAIGDSALYNNGTGAFKPSHSVYNLAIGYHALEQNTIGDNNTAIGHSALIENTDGRNNTAIGTEALSTNTSGDKNIAIGSSSLLNANADENVAIGYENMKTNTTGRKNTSVGASALFQNTTGHYNTTIGYRSMWDNSEGNYNVAMGYYSLNNNETGDLNTAIGNSSMRLNESGYSNVALGTHALYQNQVKSNLVAVGDSALYNNGSLSNGFGYAEENTAVGSKSLFSNNNGAHNTAVGFESLMSNTTARYNTAIGMNSMHSNTIGEHNTALGANSLLDNIDGELNVALGSSAMTNHTSGDHNISIGAASLHNQTSAEGNTAVGSYSGYNGTSGEHNTYLGYYSGYANLTGDNNTLLGYNAGRGASSHSKTGSVMIGHEAGYFETSDNKLYIDNSNTTSPLIYGDFGTNTLRVNGTLEIGTEYSLPNTDGANGEVLVTDGIGNLSWAGSTAGFWTDAPGSDISYSIGNVGIGLSNPDSKLHIDNNDETNGLEIEQMYSGVTASNGISIYNSSNSGTGKKVGVNAAIIPGSATTSDGIYSTIWPLAGSPGTVDDYVAVRAYANGEATALRAYTNNANGKAALFEGDVAFTHFTGTKNEVIITPANLAGGIGNSTLFLASDSQGAFGHKIEHDSLSFRILATGLGSDTERFEINNLGEVRIGEDAFIMNPNLSGNSRFTTDEIEIRGGSDLAEYFDINSIEDQPKAGMLVSIDPDNPGKLIVTSHPNCPLIAGVISGAQGIKPGMMMGQKGTLAFGDYPVTLTGRVYVKANFEGGQIKPGDILTSSSIAGQAMKVENKNVLPGTTIGKALTEVNESGYVLALISLN